ncbi:hypothetical protein RHS04_08127 [Rhizoctonia solani]|uniref:Uncharacterized protein n=1 Tax=Rhizoctonia solani TaxID=456999 RepID=A0A8H7H3Q5_9AGAM|nr:hypothetical protein RHS04_08127 [Rhizoctonia solani]
MSRLNTDAQLKPIWDEWVCRPEPATNKDWTDIQSRLTFLLEECPERAHAIARETSLSEKFNELVMKLSPPVRFVIRHRQSSMWDYTSPPPYCPPFPLFIHMRDWVIVKDLWKTHRTEQEMLALFEEHSRTIEELIVEWKRGIESHFSNLVLSKKQSRVQSPIVRPTMLRFQSRPDPLSHYTDEHKMLLRGDILFYDIEENSLSPIPMTYSEILDKNGLVASPLSLKPNSTSLTKKVNLNKYDFYVEAHLVACALMTSLNIPTASHLLLAGLGAEFQCKRCLDAQRVTWVELVRHYIVSNKLFKKNLKTVRSLCGGITYRNVHDTELCIEQPMVGYCSTNPPMELGAHTNKRRKCLLCAQIQGQESMIAPEWAIVRHLQDVLMHILERHGVAEPATHLYYTPQHVHDSIDDFGGYGLPPHDSEFF